MKPRPKVCNGCPLNPSTPGHDPETCGGHIPPSGPKGADLLVVGMSGGEEEEAKGEVFVGPSGRKIRGAVEWARDGRKLSVRWYNLVNCRTKRRGLGGEFINRDPTAKEIKECTRRWLLPELLSDPPKVLLPAGQMAYEFLTLYTPERKGEFKPREMSKGGKIPGGVAGTFSQGIGHRIRVERELYRRLLEILTPKERKGKGKKDGRGKRKRTDV